MTQLIQLPADRSAGSDGSSQQADREGNATCAGDCVVLDMIASVPSSIPPALVHIGDVLAVGASQRIPADGVVVLGTTSVDESMVTGESLPVAKVCGDAVIGGTTNCDGLVHLRVTALPSMGTMARIVSLIQGAQAERPRLQTIADVLASWFTPFILAAGVVTFAVWVAVGVAGFVDTGSLSPAPFALQFALSLIVVSCPCAIGLAVPTVIMVATSVAARLGLLLKSGAILEVLPRVRHVVFDKTGTLTTGSLTVAQVGHVDWSFCEGHAFLSIDSEFSIVGHCDRPVLYVGNGHAPRYPFATHSIVVGPRRRCGGGCCGGFDAPALTEHCRSRPSSGPIHAHGGLAVTHCGCRRVAVMTR